MAEYEPESMPRGIKLALVVTWLQTGLNALGGVFLVIAGGEDVDHGRDEGGLIMFAGGVAVVMAIALGVSSFFAAGGFVWSMIVILVFEGLAVIGTLIQFVATLNPFALIGFALATLVIGQFAGRPARQWFTA